MLIAVLRSLRLLINDLPSPWHTVAAVDQRQPVLDWPPRAGEAHCDGHHNQQVAQNNLQPGLDTVAPHDPVCPKSIL
jgi:hypothetical protein